MPTSFSSGGATCEAVPPVLSMKAEGACATASVVTSSNASCTNNDFTTLLNYYFLAVPGGSGPGTSCKIFGLPDSVCVLSSGGGALGRVGSPRCSINCMASEIGMCTAPLGSVNGCGGFNSTCSDFR